MLEAFRSTWALFLGMGLLMLGHGLQGSLLGLRANIAGFEPAVTGFVMAGYYMGFLLSSRLTPMLVARVGHVRVFAAMSSIASTTILVHILFVNPYVWFLMRFVTGVALCGIYVVAESWLNGKASNTTRGQILSLYMIVQLGGVGSGQFLLNAGDPGGYQLFIGVSVLISLALVPLLLNASPAPPFAASRSVSLTELLRVSPLGVVGVMGIGAAQGALFTMGSVYGSSIGMSVAGVSFFMAMTFLGGGLLQWPIGRLSDRFDRRIVITWVTFLAALAAALAIPFTHDAGRPLFVLFFLFGGLSLPMYSLCVAHANDFMTPDQMVGASGALLLANGIGAIAGPIAGSLEMQVIGPIGLPIFLALTHAAIGVFALYRMTKRKPMPLGEQQPHVILHPVSPVATAMAQSAARGSLDDAVARRVMADLV